MPELKEMDTGTTTVGIVAKDGVVLAADRRVSAGTFIAHKRGKKIYRLDENLALTTAGLVGDLQLLSRYITAEVELYKLKRSAPMPVEACATLTANILAGRRFFPYYVQLLIGGVDRKGGSLYSLDLAGGSIADKFVSTGSGSPYVYGVLEDHYRDDIIVSAAVDLAIRAVHTAMKRDMASGEGIDLVSITKEGYAELSEADIEKRKAAMKLT